MISSNYRFTLDLHALQSQITLPAKVGDTKRKLYISLSSGGNPYRIADGCGAKITILRETGTWVEDINCEIEDNTTIVHDFSKVPATAAVAGMHECELTLYGPGGEVLGTPRFTLLVDERLIALKDVGLTDEDYTIVDSIAAAEVIRKNSEVVRTLSETERKASEIVRVSQEAARQKNEASRVTMETDRNAAENERIKKENSRILSETDRANAEIDRMNQEALRRSAENERDRKDADRDARINGAVRVADEAKEKAQHSVDKVEEFDQELGDESIVSGHGTVKAAVNHAVITSDTALERANITHRNLVNISAQVQGIGRSYVVPDFMSFLSFLIGADFIKLSEDRDGDGVNENYFVYISDLKTGDNIIIAEKSVPDFWFEKNAALTSFEYYTYKGTEYELSAKENGVILGGAHVLETDYTVIEGFSLSASVSANNAYASEMRASESEAKAEDARRVAEQSAAQAVRSETNTKTSEDNAAASEKAAEEAALKAAEAKKAMEEFFNGLGIAQEPGNSETAVMSQKATTDAIEGVNETLFDETHIPQEQSVNLLDPKTAGERGIYCLNGKWYTSGGTDATKNSRAYILDVKPNTAYAWSAYQISTGNKYSKNLYGSFVDANGNFIVACNNVLTATAPENAAQVILQFVVFAGATVEEATEQFIPMIVEGSEPPSKYVEYIPPYKSLKEETEILRDEVSTLQNTNEIRTFDLVNPVVKKYMDEVEYDNNDYSYSYIGTGVSPYIYNDEGKHYTPNKLYRADRPLPVVLKWAYDENAVSISVLVSTNRYLTEPNVILPEQKTHSRVYQVPCGESKIAVYNLLPNTTYYYKVVALYADGTEAEIKTDNFTTSADHTRMLAIDGVDNVRDIGGYTVYNSEGISIGTVKHERIYRGAGLDEDSFHGRRITDSGIYELIRQVGVRAELDLRGNRTKVNSPIGADLEKENDFLTVSAQSYLGVFSELGKSATKEAFEFILAKLKDDTALDTSDYKPVYIHCQGGADRTGCLVYLLLGVLGVNENDLCKEWELTSFGCQGYRVRCSTSMNLQGFITQLKTYAGNTLNEKIENFLINCDISSADIADFKSIMIG